MQQFIKHSMRLGGRLLTIERPLVMGVVNATPDSFYAASRAMNPADIERKVRKMVDAGVDVIDIGGCSTRPGSQPPDAGEELARLRVALPAARRAAPDVPLSVDTYRASVATEAVERLGADMVNDISGGTLDDDMFAAVAALRVPYVLTHSRGTPATMSSMTDYGERGVVAEVTEWLMRRIDILHGMGVADVIADPGFGFAKTVEQNYALMAHLAYMVQSLGVPMLVGVSRKSMITHVTGDSAEDTLPGTVALNTAAMLAGAHIVRVHDVRAAVQAREVICRLLTTD